MIHYLMTNNLKYIGLIIIIILFGVFSLPKIYERVINSDIKDSNRLNKNERLSFLSISNEKRKAPDFILTNQDSILISNEDLTGKVYVLEFGIISNICLRISKVKPCSLQSFSASNFVILSFIMNSIIIIGISASNLEYNLGFI